MARNSQRLAYFSAGLLSALTAGYPLFLHSAKAAVARRPSSQSCPLPAAPAREVTVDIGWPEPQHRFLQGAHVELETGPASGRGGRAVALEPADDSSGAQVTGTLTLRAGEQVRLHADFEPTLEDPVTSAPIKARVFSVDRAYDVVADRACGYLRLSPRPADAGKLVTESEGDPRAGRLSIRIDTTFVDLTEIWRQFNAHPTGQYAVPPSKVYSDFDRDWRHLRMLGFTRGTPELWAVYLPEALLSETASPDAVKVSRLAFFKHADFYYAHQNTGLGGPARGMWLINQFLLSGRQLRADERIGAHMATTVSNDVSNQWEFNPAPDGKHYRTNWLRVGIARSLEASRRPLLLVIPWRQDGKPDDSINGRLPERTNRIIAFLHEQGRLLPHGRAVPGKLAISGYSGGGGIAVSAFLANLGAVDELYLFDPVDGDVGSKMRPEELRAIRGWLLGRPGARLRVVSSLSPGAWQDVVAGAESPGRDGVSRASLLPESLRFWRSADEGGSGWFNYQIEYERTIADTVAPLDKGFSNYAWFEHQFALNGGLGESPETGTPWLQLFLEESAL